MTQTITDVDAVIARANFGSDGLLPAIIQQ